MLLVENVDNIEKKQNLYIFITMKNPSIFMLSQNIGPEFSIL